jgi:hypothetical protein
LNHFVHKLTIVNIESLSAEIRSLNTMRLGIERAYENGVLSDRKTLHPKDRIRHLIEQFLPQAIKKTDFLTTLLEDMQSSFENCLIYYGEEPKDNLSRQQFFHKFDIFVRDYKRVKKENFEMEEEAHRADMRRKAITKASQKNIMETAMQPAAPNHAVMDNLLEKLRSGPDVESRKMRRRMMPKPRAAETLAAIRKAAAEEPAKEPESDLKPLPVSRPASSSGNNALLAARAQSMLAGLRSGKVTGAPSVAGRTPPGSRGSILSSGSLEQSPIRFGLVSAELREEEDSEEAKMAPEQGEPIEKEPELIDEAPPSPTPKASPAKEVESQLTTFVEDGAI